MLASKVTHNGCDQYKAQIIRDLPPKAPMPPAICTSTSLPQKYILSLDASQEKSPPLRWATGVVISPDMEQASQSIALLGSAVAIEMELINRSIITPQ